MLTSWMSQDNVQPPHNLTQCNASRMMMTVEPILRYIEKNEFPKIIITYHPNDLTLFSWITAKMTYVPISNKHIILNLFIMTSSSFQRVWFAMSNVEGRCVPFLHVSRVKEGGQSHNVL